MRLENLNKMKILMNKRVMMEMIMKRIKKNHMMIIGVKIKINLKQIWTRWMPHCILKLLGNI